MRKSTRGVLARIVVAVLAGLAVWLLMRAGGVAAPGPARPNATASSEATVAPGAKSGGVVAPAAAVHGELSERRDVTSGECGLDLHFRWLGRGGAVPGVRAHLFSEAGGRLVGPAVSDRSGAAVFDSLQVGAYHLMVAGPWLLPQGQTSIRIGLAGSRNSQTVDLEEGYIARYRFVNGDVLFHQRQPVAGFREVLIRGAKQLKSGDHESVTYRRIPDAATPEARVLVVMADSARHGRCEFEVPLVSARADDGAFATLCDFSGKPMVESVEIAFEILDATGQRVDIGGIILTEQRTGDAVPSSMVGGVAGVPVRVPLGRVYNKIKVGTFPVMWDFLGVTVDTSDAVDGVLRVPLALPCEMIPVDIVVNASGGDDGLLHLQVKGSEGWREWVAVRARGGVRKVVAGEVNRVLLPPGDVTLKVLVGAAVIAKKIDVTRGMGVVAIDV